MAKGMYEKSLKITPKPAKKPEAEVSFVTGTQQSKVPKYRRITAQKKK